MALGSKRGRVHSALDNNKPVKSARLTKRGQNGRIHLRKNQHLPDAAQTAPVSVPEWSPNDEVEGWEIDDTSNLVDVDCDLLPESVRRRYISSDDPMAEWIDKKQEFLDEFMRREGQSEEALSGFCRRCRQGEVDRVDDGHVAAEEPLRKKEDSAPVYRCKDCFGNDNTCLACCLELHESQPLHRIQRWNGLCFEAVSLSDLGLRVQLGHSGGRCPAPESGRKTYTILHVNGLHTVTLDFCGCERRVPHRRQFLRAGWYPATVKYPATVATLELLKHFHGLSLCSKVSAHEYYLNLERLTSNTRVNIPKTRYRAFLRMVRQYRHLQMLKRAGRGNTRDGVQNIGPGELALTCPACPQPGINLPANWMCAAIAMSFLYTLFVSIDANFRLKNRLRTNDKDHTLHTGLAYFVEEKPYNDHILKHTSEADINSCSGFNAIARADSKATAGLRSTGVGMCVCSRHELIRPLGVGDLQKGERYCNMDYIFSSALAGTILTTIMAIYDIACQWKVRFQARMSQLPPKLQLPPTVHVDFAIPKCHCPAHKEACQTPHSLNLMPGAGRTDGKGIERDWSMLNPAASSTKEMGPGSRHDTLDDLFAYHNWQKTTALGHSLKRKYLIAAVQLKRHTEMHREFCDSVSPSIQARWLSMIMEWEKDKSKPNPYVSIVTHQSESAVKLVLLQTERGDVGLGDWGQEKTATAFISTGLVVEETQRRLRLDLSNKELTTIQASQLTERRLNITRQVRRYRIIQKDYIPFLDALTDGEPSISIEPEKAALWLPSAIPARLRSSLPPDLVDREVRLRKAQCYDALERIRLTQRAKRHVVIFKAKNPRGQRTGIRFRGGFERLDIKILRAAEKYRDAYKALIELVGTGSIPSDLKVLRQSDIVPPPAFDDSPVVRPTTLRQVAERLGEGYREVPWIWRTGVVLRDGEDAVLNDGLRVEWAKSRARSLRWTEEVILLKEEMRRVRLTFKHRADLWRKRAEPWDVQPSDPCLAQGIAAYAIRQSHVYDLLRTHFTKLWETPPHKRANLADVLPPGNEDECTAADEAMLTDLLAEARECDAEAVNDVDEEEEFGLDEETNEMGEGEEEEE